MTYSDVAYTAVTAFFVLLVVGVWMEELEIKHAIVFVIIWAAGLGLFNYFGISRLVYVSIEVILDVVLIIKIFGRDIRADSD